MCSALFVLTFVFHFQSSSWLRACALVDARIFVCVNQFVRLKLVMMVMVLGCNEASCVAPSYSIVPLGTGICQTPSYHPACLTAT